MRALLLILTAFFLQSCYTIIYRTDEYWESGDETYSPPVSNSLPIRDRPHSPYIPAPPPESYAPASGLVEEAPARPRTDGDTRGAVDVRPLNASPERLRTNAPAPAYKPQPADASESRPRVQGSSRDTRADNPAAAENPVRVRTSSPSPAAPAQSAAPVRQETQSANTSTRERTTEQTPRTEPRPRQR